MEFLPYGKQSISEKDCDAVKEALTGAIITRGEKVDAFEKAIAQYCGANFAVAFNSGSSALLAAYRAADLKPADRVITTPNSFIATAAAPFLTEASPIFVDIDKDTGDLNVEQVSYTLQPPMTRGKTVIAPVHFAGIAVDMQALDRLNSAPHSVVIEDAAHALGSHYPSGEKVGSCAYSQMTVFSFHPIKNITTGEGGMVTTNDEELFQRLKLFRDNGIKRNPKLPWHYEVVQVSGNYNFTDFQAALGLSQLKRLDTFGKKRLQLMQKYRESLKEFEHVRLFSEECDARTFYHLCVVQIDFEAYQKTRSSVMQALLDKEIGTQVHYIPIYKHPFFTEKKGDISEYFPNMETYYSQALTLPLFYDMTEEDVKRVVDVLKAVLHG